MLRNILVRERDEIDDRTIGEGNRLSNTCFLPFRSTGA